MQLSSGKLARFADGAAVAQVSFFDTFTKFVESLSLLDSYQVNLTKPSPNSQVSFLSTPLIHQLTLKIAPETHEIMLIGS